MDRPSGKATSLRRALALSSLLVLSPVITDTVPAQQARAKEEQPAAAPGKSGPAIEKILKPKELLKDLSKREWYREKKDQEARKHESRQTQNEEDLSSIQKSASEEIESILVLVGEISLSDRRGLFAPVFLTDKKNIFDSRSDFSFRWVGLKFAAGLAQRGFPWGGATLSETFIGSFLYASGTNVGFYGEKRVEERRFYTNYVSQIVTLKQALPLHTAAAFTLDSRQYFFIERDPPDDFTMPQNHVNVFPRIDLGLEMLTEKGIDQLTRGVEVKAWAGYGARSRWSDWGEPTAMEKGDFARTFVIYSAIATAGLLFAGTHNLVFRAHYKGGQDNDFLTQPRFGGSIDNAKLDVVHGFTVDRFRVEAFGLCNLRYGFDLFRRLRLNLFLDYAHVFRPDPEDILGSAYGLRILAWGGLPIWITHGLGKRYHPGDHPIEQMVMIMTAAGW